MLSYLESLGLTLNWGNSDQQKASSTKENKINPKLKARSPENQAAMEFFVSTFKHQFLETYLVYKQFAADDTWWNNLKSKMGGSAAKTLAETATNQLIDVATSSLGSESAEIAKELTSTGVQGAFLIYTTLQAKKKQARIDIAKKMAIYAKSEEQFLVLAEEVAIALFNRFEKLICALQSPHGVEELLAFFQTAIIQGIEKGNIPANFTQDEKINRLVKYAVPSEMDAQYSGQVFGKIVLKTSDGVNKSWTLEGALCRSVHVVAGREVYAFEQHQIRLSTTTWGMRYDNKYPPQYLPTQKEANDLGLKSVENLRWANFSRQNPKQKTDALNEYFGLLAGISSSFTDTTWLTQQVARINKEYENLFDSLDRESQKTIFKRILDFYIAQQNAQPFWGFLKDHMESPFPPLESMLLHLYENSQEQTKQKWRNYQARLSKLGIVVALARPRASDAVSIRSAVSATFSHRSSTTPSLTSVDESGIPLRSFSTNDEEGAQAEAAEAETETTEVTRGSAASASSSSPALGSSTAVPLRLSVASSNPDDEVRQFLQHVVSGNQEQAQKMLIKRPSLALATADVTDSSGREFKGITGFQCAVWYLDWRMWRMIQTKGHLEAAEIKRQLEAMKQASWVAEHGYHADWSPLIKAYEDYHDNWNKAAPFVRPPVPRPDSWIIGVGENQHKLPVHAVNEYCHPAQSFNDDSLAKLEANFKNVDFPMIRSREILVGSLIGGASADWYEGKFGDGTLGKSFAVFNKIAIGNGNDLANGMMRGLYLFFSGNTTTSLLKANITGEISVEREKLAFAALYRVRMEQRQALINEYAPELARRHSFIR